ncbi:hypothetical protein [Streptomyces sp. NPDC052042]|uniref:hypothetical protein n=1 Tax=Streptomyces sp. NPDC052042 TaxID=3365683 RepID=UPI0037D1749A
MPAEQCAAGRPIVVMNAPFDLPLPDRELRRYQALSSAARLQNVPLCVLDPRVLDKHLDRCREGRRGGGSRGAAAPGVAHRGVSDAGAVAAHASRMAAV